MHYFSAPTAQALSWTLLHSLWQGVLIMFALILLLRCIPTQYSRIRYAVSLTALFGLLASAVITFTVYTTAPVAEARPTQQNPYQFVAYHPQPATANAAQLSWIDTASHWVNTNNTLILTLWLIGATLFSLRVTAGWFYINTLRQRAHTLNDSWQQYIQTLATQLKVSRLVQVAESSIVQAPVVLGYLKPVILLPVGMIGGLSTEQIETILIHELVHIRRHDYIVNLIQSCIEAIFFFNPCIWFISQQVRNEREHCCDDAVVNMKGSAKHYIHALAMLEEVRLSRTGLALSLAENKNILLNRMKRMMEKTAKKHSGRERLVPAALLMIGLLCASWISIKSPSAEYDANDIATIQKDTTIKRNEKSGSYSRTVITTIDKDGKPHKEVFEEYDGDQSEHKSYDMDFSVDLPEPPEVPDMAHIPPVPDMPIIPDFPAMPSLPSMTVHMGALDPIFDSTMHRQIETAMNMHFDTNMADWSKEMAKWDEAMQGWNAEHSEQFKAFEAKMRAWEEENADKIASIEKHAQAIEANAKEFEKELQKQLVNDGYLKKNESLNSVEWSNGELKVNGKQIEDKHRAKYDELHKKFFHTTPGKMIYIR